MTAPALPYCDERVATQHARWHPCADRAALERAAVQAILAAAARAIAERGSFHFVLAGGETPRGIYRALSQSGAQWPAWHCYFGDERCLPPDDPERNSTLAATTWLDRSPIPAAQRHVIPAERGPETAASAYAAILRPVGTFDLVLLGLGEDGHTASLFPGREIGASPGAPDALAILDAPKPPPERVTLSAARLSRTREAIFVVAGESKRQALKAWRAGEDIPANAIRPPAGVDVLFEALLMTP